MLFKVREIKKEHWLLLLIIVLGVSLRLYKIDEIPSEIFGDIVENINHTRSVLDGQFNVIYGYDGRQAMFFYLNALLAYFLGNTYLTLKIACVLIGTVTIYAVFLLAKELTNEKTALLSAFLVAVSKWPLVFSRIGFRAVLVPLFVAITFYFLIRATKTGKNRDFMYAGLFLGLGLYTYTAFLFAILSVFMVTAYYFIVKRYKKGFLIMFLIFGLVVSPMLFRVVSSPDIYFSHSNPMLFDVNGGIRSDWLPVLIGNIKNQLMMFNYKGDIAFRVNLEDSPAVDLVSGVFLLLGILVLILHKGSRKISVAVFLPFMILQLPSILVINYPIDIPSFTRSIGIIPFVYLLIAIGIYNSYKIILAKDDVLAKAILVSALGFILISNWYQYFILYPYGLPNSNTPYGKTIAQEIDKLPKFTKVYVIGCCWGDWGQPEPNAIRFALKIPREVKFLEADDNKETFVCEKFANKKNLYFVVNPNWTDRMDTINKCLPGGIEYDIGKNGYFIAQTYRM